MALNTLKTLTILLKTSLKLFDQSEAKASILRFEFINLKNDKKLLCLKLKISARLWLGVVNWIL